MVFLFIQNFEIFKYSYIMYLMATKGKKRIYSILGIIIVLLLNLVGGSFIKNIFYTISAPMQKVLYSAGEGSSNLFSGLFTSGALKKANQELIKQNILLKQSLSLKESYKKENTMLRQVLDFAEEQDFQLLIADVLSISPEEDMVLTSVGKASGAVKDMPVITEYGILVGKVTEVFEHFSHVTLISSQKIAFDIEIQSTSTESVLAASRGGGEGKMFFGLAPQLAVINSGDIVKTAALGGQFPKSILVGEISEFRKNDAESFQEGAIMPYFTDIPLQRLFLITNFNKLQVVPYDDE